ncbi:MAG: hypothetical protein AAGK32_04165, partial [Actinomycetota bacterium]
EIAASGGPNMRVLENGLMGQLLDRGYRLRTHVLSNYYGAERSGARSGEERDGILWVLPAGLSHPPTDAVPVASYRPEGQDPAAHDRLAAEVAAHARAAGSLELAPGAELNMSFVLYGHLPQMCPTERSLTEGCDDGADWFEHPDRFLDAPDEAILDAYRSRFITSPQLDPALDQAVQDLSSRPITVWLGPYDERAR